MTVRLKRGVFLLRSCFTNYRATSDLVQHSTALARAGVYSTIGGGVDSPPAPVIAGDCEAGRDRLRLDKLLKSSSSSQLSTAKLITGSMRASLITR